jgi:hypothetical protein
MGKKVDVGEAFGSLEAVVEENSNDAEVIAANTTNNESRTRTNLAYGTFAVGSLFVLTTGGIGVYDGSFDELQGVWMVGGPLIGGVFVHYFGPARKIKDDESKG